MRSATASLSPISTAPKGLARIDALFLAHLAPTGLADQLAAARRDPDGLEPKAESELLIALGPHLEDFLARLFGIETEAAALARSHNALAPIFACKRLFVQRRALKAVKPDELAGIDADALLAELGLVERGAVRRARLRRRK